MKAWPLFLCALLTLAAVPSPASAHQQYPWYAQKWVRDRSQTYRFVKGYPSGATRDRVVEQGDDWRALSGHMGFTLSTSADYASFAWDVCPQPYGKNGIHWKNLERALGAVAVCTEATPSYTEVMSANMAIDSSPYAGYSWNTSAGEPSPTQWDLGSVASHEWGHMTGRIIGGTDGLGHWDVESALCTSNPKHTLCPSLLIGTSFRRSTELHDEDTFNAAYP